MECLPIQTRIMRPPKDDLFALFDEVLTDVQERDVIMISSKVVAIDEGRCIPVLGTDKDALVKTEADVCIPTAYRDRPLTIKHHAFLGAAGIDESNGDGHYILLPQDPYASARRIHQHLTKKYKVTNLGVVITDSRSQPFRFGATGIAIGFYGIAPLESHIGKEDLFGRTIKYERSDVVDGLAAAACVVSGEVAESCPIVIIRGVPRLEFRDGNLKDELMVEPAQDTFRVLYERFLGTDW